MSFTPKSTAFLSLSLSLSLSYSYSLPYLIFLSSVLPRQLPVTVLRKSNRAMISRNTSFLAAWKDEHFCEIFGVNARIGHVLPFDFSVTIFNMSVNKKYRSSLP